jgi:phosphate:Na+ symporter
MILASYVVGGLVLFLYGMKLTSDGLREAAGGTLRAALTVLTARRSTGILSGIVLTFLLSSSSAVVVMLVNLSNSGLLNLEQAILVVLGSAVGTALTVQVITFRLASVALLIVAGGFTLHLFARYRRAKSLGLSIFGLGLVFFGLNLINEGAAAAGPEGWIVALQGWLGHPFLGPAVAFFTAVLVSAVIRSAGTVGLAVVLAGHGVPLVDLLPVVLGAEVGTCAMGLASSLGGDRKGKQVAVSELVFRVLAAAVFLPLIKPTAELVTWATNYIGFESGPVGLARRSVANAHLFIGVVSTLLAVPFIPVLTKLVRRIVGAPHDVPPGALQYINFNERLSHEESLSRAHQETVRMATMSRGLVRRAVRAVTHGDDRALELIEQSDDRVDIVDEVLSVYLARLAPAELSDEELEVKSKLLYIVKDLEQVADLATREVTRIGWEKSQHNVRFGDAERRDLEEFLTLIDTDFGRVIDVVGGSDASEESRALVLEHERWMDLERSRLFELEVSRTSAGAAGAEAAGAAFMNVVNILRMVHTLLADVVRVVSERPPSRSVPGESSPPG